MKVSDIIEFGDKMAECNFPMTSNVCLEISRDDASELLIELIYINGMYDKDKATSYLNSGIAYKFINGSRIAGIKVLSP
jgi:hypothetical protein